MLGSLFRRLAGQRPEPAQPPAPVPPTVEEVRADAPAAVEAGMEPDLPVPGPSGGLDLPAPPGMAGKSPVFSSRAVRDATVVTGTIESLTRFVGGQDVLDDLTWRLESLTTDQVNFLQLSAEPGLIQRAQARSETLKGAKAAALRKLLTDLAGGAIPEPANRVGTLSIPKGPIVPPLTSLQPRPANPAEATGTTPSSAPPPGPALGPTLGPANPQPPGPGAPSLTTAPPLATRPIPPAPAKPVQPPPVPPMPPVAKAPPAAPSIAVPLPPLSAVPEGSAPARREMVEVRPSLTATPPVAKVPEPEPAVARPPEPPAVRTPEPVVKAPPVKAPEPVAAPVAAAPVPAPSPPPTPEPVKVPEPLKVVVEPLRLGPVPVPAPEPDIIPSVPRLGRQDAEARRARLLASLNDTLSSSEAAP